LSDSKVIHFYNQRGEDSENRIKELKNDFGARQMPCGDFNANALYFDICSLSYNLFALMRQILPLEFANKRAKHVRNRLYANSYLYKGKNFINSEIIDSSGAFTTGDKIKVRLFLNESVTLAKVGSNKIIVANKEFLLTGTNGVTTDTLEFVYIVKINDNISAENFDIDSKEDIVLSDVKDVDGNSINFSAITDSVELANLVLDTGFRISDCNKINQTKGIYEKISDRSTGVYEKTFDNISFVDPNEKTFSKIKSVSLIEKEDVHENTSNGDWNVAITSTKGFSGDGCVIAKIGSNNKDLMVGLSTDNNNNEGNYHTIDFAIYVHNSGNIVGIYENGRSIKSFDEDQYPYTAGDYLKIERDGATINYYLVKVGDDPATEGTLLYNTPSRILSTDTKLFLDSSLHDIGAKLSDIQILNNRLPLSVSAKSIRQVSTTGGLENNNVFGQVFNDNQSNNNDETNTSSNEVTSTTDSTNNNTTTNNTNTTDNTQETGEQKTNKAEKWFNSKVNQKFSRGLSFSQTTKVFIITDFSDKSLDLGMKLRKKNDIVLYYNTENHEIEYLHGQQNDIEIERIEYQTIAYGKVVNILVEDIDSGEYIVNTDDNPEDEIDAEAIVAQLQQAITLQRTATGLRRNWFTRHSFAKKELAFDSLFFTSGQNPSQPDTQPVAHKTSKYQSNLIVQSSDDPIVIEAANALFNKHPDSSVLVKFDQDGNLVTLKGEAYTPTGDTRVNFVGHGNDLSQEGAQSLADKVKILQQTYGNDSTDIKRIALVGCGTDGVNQSLTQDFAKAIYNDTPELKTAEITGRKGDMQINPDGTKTMETGSESNTLGD
jgi:hypothetical protein